MIASADGCPHQRGRAASRSGQKVAWFATFLIFGLLVFVIFSHYYPVFAGSLDLWGRVAVTAIFFAAALLARRTQRWAQYARVLFAFGTACAAISLDFYLGLSRWVLPALSVDANTPAGWAIDKLESSLLGVAVVLVLTLASGQRLASLYLQRGTWRPGLALGLGVLLIMLVTAVPLAQAQFRGRHLSWARILPWLPWLLIFVLANAFNEELLFRGLFFGRLEPFLGPFATNLLMTIPFLLMHTGVDYASDLNVFLLMLFPLSLAWGWLLQKTQSVWGSVLFHAAMDIPVILGMFSTLS